MFLLACFQVKIRLTPLEMHITLISAMTRNRVIGSDDGGIPWDLPRDREHFRKFTDGRHLLLGRRTFEEMSGWFTNQTPIILTRNREYKPEPGYIAGNVDEAISLASELGARQLVVCGGGSVYDAALPYTDELFLTLIDSDLEGGTRFPDYESDIEWEEVSREHFPADRNNDYGMTFLHLRRLHPSSLRPPRLHLI